MLRNGAGDSLLWKENFCIIRKKDAKMVAFIVSLGGILKIRISTV
jgi:hypothetical protein